MRERRRERVRGGRFMRGAMVGDCMLYVGVE
jgi:hypothetical protein